MRGGRRVGAGRKSGPNSPTISRTIRWNPDEWMEIEEAAEAEQNTVSDFIRAAAIEKARKKKN